jgi:hypothetical protein
MRLRGAILMLAALALTGAERPAGFGGQVIGVRRVAPAPAIEPDLAEMARLAMNYLSHSPRPALDYECHFLIYPLAVPPTRGGQNRDGSGDVITDNQGGVAMFTHTEHDPISWGDTDARMDVVFPYMREMSGSTDGRAAEAGLHGRVLSYMREDGLCWLPPGGLFRTPKEYALPWTSGLLMTRLVEDWQRTHDPATLASARKLLAGIERLATRQDGRAWHDGGMMPWFDGAWQWAYGPKGGWTRQPGIAWPVAVYWKATREPEALRFARELAEGVLANSQPKLDVHSFAPDGSFQGGNTHLVLHEVLGVAELGAALNEPRYTAFARRVYEYVRSIGMDWGWFPEYRVHYLGDRNSETCNTADMVALATSLAEAGLPQYWDDAERFTRNYIRVAQYRHTDEVERMAREANPAKPERDVRASLALVRQMEGGFIGALDTNSWLTPLQRAKYDSVELRYRMNISGCCSPSGMWALHRAWQRIVTEERGVVRINMALRRDAAAARVTPSEGLLRVQARHAGTYQLRVPAWAARRAVTAARNGTRVAVKWGGPAEAYVVFDAVAPSDELVVRYPPIAFDQRVTVGGRSGPLDVRISWRGNSVVDIQPRAKRFALFGSAK